MVGSTILLCIALPFFELCNQGGGTAGESCYTSPEEQNMKDSDFVDNAIIALAAAAPDGTTWDEVVRDAHALAAARRAHGQPIGRPIRATGGRLSQETRARRRELAREIVLNMVRSAPGGVYSGGIYALAAGASCGRNAAASACNVLIAEGLITPFTSDGCRFLRYTPNTTVKE